MLNEKGLPVEPINENGMFLKTSNATYKIGCISGIPDMIKAAKELNSLAKNTMVHYRSSGKHEFKTSYLKNFVNFYYFS